MPDEKPACGCMTINDCSELCRYPEALRRIAELERELALYKPVASIKTGGTSNGG